MANLPKIVNVGRVTKNFKESLSTRTGINNFNSDSVVRSMYLPLISEIDRINNENRKAFEAIQIDSAQGKDLDLLAANYGIARLETTFAGSTADERNFLFYADDSFGSINSGQDIMIPKGTRIVVSETAVNQIVYEVVQDYVLGAASSKAYCAVRSLTAGSSSNVGSANLTKHNFANYTGSSLNTLKCKNIYPIVNGRNRESDESLRYRVVNYYASIAKDSEDSLFLRSLEVPGVIALKTIPNYFGIGSMGIFVFGASNKSSRSLIREVEEKLEPIKAPGIKYLVLPGVVVYLDLDLSIYLDREIDGQLQNDIKDSIRASIGSFFNENANIDRVSVGDLRDLILKSDARITGVLAKDGSSNIFKSIYVRRSYGETPFSSERFQIISSSIKLEENEYFNLGTLDLRFEVSKQ